MTFNQLQTPLHICISVRQHTQSFLWVGLVTVLFGDIDLNGSVNLLDVNPFIVLINSGGFQIEGDFDGDGNITLLDVSGFIDALSP